jgi:hypothetical protein
MRHFCLTRQQEGLRINTMLPQYVHQVLVLSSGSGFKIKVTAIGQHKAIDGERADLNSSARASTESVMTILLFRILYSPWLLVICFLCVLLFLL